MLATQKVELVFTKTVTNFFPLALDWTTRRKLSLTRPAIILVDDDTDDEQLLRDALGQLGNPFPLTTSAGGRYAGV